MATLTLEELYEQYIKPLPLSERLRLVAIITTQDLARQAGVEEQGPKRDIMELHGLGAEIWKGVDVQEYLNALRDEFPTETYCSTATAFTLSR